MPGCGRTPVRPARSVSIIRGRGITMANKPKLGVAGLFLAAGIGLSGCQNGPPARQFGQGSQGVGGQRIAQQQQQPGPSGNRVQTATGQPGGATPYGLQPNQQLVGGGQPNSTGFGSPIPPAENLNNTRTISEVRD